MADRRNKTLRDMGLSIGIIVVVVLLFVGLYGGFSFSPGTPTGGQVVATDVQGGFATASRTVGFPVVQPKGLPVNWQGNSFSLTAPGPVGAAPAAVRGGWITPDGAFVSLVESSGTIPEVLTAEIGAAGSVTGAVQAGGAAWSIAPGRRAEQAWVRQSGGVTLLITGSAGPEVFTQVATAVAGG